MSQAMAVVGVPPAPPEPPPSHPCYEATIAATGIDPARTFREFVENLEAAKGELRKVLGT